MFEIVINEEIVDIIGDDDEIMLDGDAEQFAHVRRRDDVGGRVIGGDQQERAGLVGDSGADIGWIGAEVVFGESLHLDLDTAGEGEGIGIGVVVGFGHDHLIAGTIGRDHHEEERFLPAVGDDDFGGGIDIDIVDALDALGDGLAEGEQALRGAVVGMMVDHGVFGRFDNMGWRVKVGVAAAHDDDVIVGIRLADQTIEQVGALFFLLAHFASFCRDQTSARSALAVELLTVRRMTAGAPKFAPLAAS